jgi:hypothetical protein
MPFRTFLFSFLAVAAGCAGETDTGGPVGSEAGAVERRLAGGIELDIATDVSNVQIAGEVGSARERFEREDLAVVEGEVRIRSSARHTLVLEELRVSVSDIVISSEIVPPNGVTLTDIAVELVAPAEGSLTWYGDEGYAEVTVDMNVAWALMSTEGRALSLAPQTVEDLTFGVTVRIDSRGRLVAELTAHAQGDVIDWPTVTKIDELNVDLTSRESPL